jgi:hypothetical protein
MRSPNAQHRAKTIVGARSPPLANYSRCTRSALHIFGHSLDIFRQHCGALLA